MKTTTQRFFFSLALLAGLVGSVNATPAFTITPSAVSNTYSGKLTLLVTGLTNGESVVVQKYLDLNGNGVVDAGDRLMQQYTLTDGQLGMVIGGVTNFNVPGDYDTTTGQITAKMFFADGDFAQTIVGNYLFVVSSPTGAATNSFAVTNFPFAQKLTGRVLENGVSAPGAVVIVFPPPSGGNQGLGSPVALTLADSSGNYTVALPAGSYLPFAFGSNAVANVQASPVLTLNASQTITTNLMLTNATATITGQIVDYSNPSLGLPGIFLPINTQTGLIASTGSDTNGNFTVGVLPGTWQFEGEPAGLLLHGYVGYQNHTNVNAGTSFTAPFLKANALFYGQVVDALGNPMADIDIYVNDNNGQFQSDSYTDNKGNYVIGAVGGLGGDTWNVQVSTGGGGTNPTNYVFSEPAFDQNGGTNLNAGQAVQVNFTALVATNYISGNVQFQGTNVVGVGVFASATIGGVNYSVFMDTDANGNYAFNVANGDWSVGVNCNGGNDSLDNLLGPGTYQCPNNQNVTITNGNATANFVIQPCGGIQIINPGTTNLPSGQMGNYYSFQFQASTCSGNSTWSQVSGSLPSGLTLYSGGALNGTPGASGTFDFTVQVSDGSGNSTNVSFSLTINASGSPLQINTGSLPNGTNGAFYSQTLQASGGTPPYSWSIPNYSVPPPNLALANDGVLSGTPQMNGKFYFDVVVTDAASNTVEEDGLALTILNNPPLPPVVITNVSLPSGTVGVAYSAQLGASGGQVPYNWSLAVGSANPPPGLTLYSSGLISGTPVSGGIYYFQVQAADAYSTTANKVLSIAVSATVTKPAISSARYSGGQFQMLLNGVTNQNYTVQMSTNLSSTSWTTLYITNNPATNTFLLSDPNATNKQRFYRILVGP
jgi:hypothetical protein